MSDRNYAPGSFPQDFCPSGTLTHETFNHGISPHYEFSSPVRSPPPFDIWYFQHRKLRLGWGRLNTEGGNLPGNENSWWGKSPWLKVLWVKVPLRQKSWGKATERKFRGTKVLEPFILILFFRNAPKVKNTQPEPSSFHGLTQFIGDNIDLKIVSVNVNLPFHHMGLIKTSSSSIEVNTPCNFSILPRVRFSADQKSSILKQLEPKL